MVSVKIYSNYFLTTTQIFDLRFDVVGIDNELFRRCEKPASVEAGYEAVMKKTKRVPFVQYVRQNYLPEYIIRQSPVYDTKAGDCFIFSVCYVGLFLDFLFELFRNFE